MAGGEGPSDDEEEEVPSPSQVKSIVTGWLNFTPGFQDWLKAGLPNVVEFGGGGAASSL